MVLGNFPRPGRPTNLDDSRTRAYCACRPLFIYLNNLVKDH